MRRETAPGPPETDLAGQLGGSCGPQFANARILGKQIRLKGYWELLATRFGGRCWSADEVRSWGRLLSTGPSLAETVRAQPVVRLRDVAGNSRRHPVRLSF